MEISTKKLAEIIGIRPQVLEFALEMEKKLQKNDHKGGWAGERYTWLIDKLKQETKELDKAVTNFQTDNSMKNMVAVMGEAADVANFAMMISDNAKNQ